MLRACLSRSSWRLNDDCWGGLALPPPPLFNDTSLLTRSVEFIVGEALLALEFEVGSLKGNNGREPWGSSDTAGGV